MKTIKIALSEKSQYRLETVLEEWNADLTDEQKYTIGDLFNVLLYREFDKIISKGGTNDTI